MKKWMRGTSVLLGGLALVGCASDGGISRQDTKTRIMIQYAEVEAVEPVTFESEAGKTAAIGGLWGLLAGSSGDRGDLIGGALAGAALLGLTTKIAEGASTGTAYTLRNVGGSAPYKIITDDKHAQVGDCVAVETARTTNVRRVEQSLCQPKMNHPVEQEIEKDMQQSALQCDTAKQHLLKATTDTDISAAIKKVKVLCE